MKFTSNPWQWFVHLILPWFTLSVLFIGFYSRVLRSTILDTINEDYVRTAKAKGLSERQVLMRHVLRNSLIPIISLWGLDMAAVIGGGAILTESVFGLHGVGAARSRLDRPARHHPDPGDRDADRILRGALRGAGRHPLRLPRSADPPDMTDGARDGALLEVDDLHVSFATEDGTVQAVDGVSFGVDSGEVVAIVGESGSGKSVTAMTLMGLTRGPNAKFEGAATFDGHELITASEDDLQKVRGPGIAMVFQDPMSSLNPVYRIGKQIVEQIRVHDHEVSKAQAMDRAVVADGAGRGSRARLIGCGPTRTSSRAACASA